MATSTRVAATSLAVLLALAVMACGGGERASPPGSQPGENAELTPDDLLAVLNPDDVKEAFVQPEIWWPTLPEINVGFEPAPEPVAGDRFWVTQSYQQVGSLASGRVETTLILFEGEAQAEAGFAALAAIDEEGGVVTEGPAVGDASRYVALEASEEEVSAGALPFQTLLRYRVGPIVGRISVLTELGHEPVATLASYFAPIGRRAEALLAGDLKSTDLPEWALALLPAAETPVGPVFGSAVRPAESWALVDTTGDPQAVLGHLHALGVTELGLRRFGLAAEPDLVVEATVYRTKDTRSATEWVSDFVQSAETAGTLDPGATGDVSAYTSYGGEFYELQFAKGHVVGDVVCFAPFAATTAACEDPVRAFVERWYAELPAP